MTSYQQFSDGENAAAQQRFISSYICKTPRLLLMGMLSCLCAASSASAAILLTDDNQYTVVPSENPLIILLVFAALFILVALVGFILRSLILAIFRWRSDPLALKPRDIESIKAMPRAQSADCTKV